MLFTIISIILVIGFGCVFAFWGSKIFYALMGIWGVLTGFLIGISYTDNFLLGAVIGLGIGVIYALLVKFLYKASLGITGAFLGFLLANQLLGFAPMITSPFTDIIKIAVAIVVGILFARSSEIVISVCTSLYGASIIAPTALLFITNLTSLSRFEVAGNFSATLNNVLSYSQSSSAVALLAVIIITIVGTRIQLKREKQTHNGVSYR